METNTQDILEFFELANHYPSPHNGQPIEVKQLGTDTFELYFQKERGLQAAEVSFLFSYVTMGVFITHLSLCAKALGHEMSHELQLPPVRSLKGTGAVKFASCKIRFSATKPDEALQKTLVFRQTSRKKYYEGINEALSQQTIAIAAEKHMQLVKMNRPDTHQAIWLNQRAVFDDMFDDSVRHELDHWLRYSKNEKKTKRDGLAYDCMELNGRAMKLIVNHYKILHWPVVSNLLKKYYLRTMSDNSNAFYLLTPFSTELEAYDVGVAVMQIWRAIATQGYYLHPFGTIMSNVEAHDDFLKLAHIDHEDRSKNFLVFIYRAGKSKTPHNSLRIPIKDHLLRSQDV
ncbi:MAG TPA: hypothetical protein VH234_01060 [Candidatus Saccharimonadales bacterium]|jgi:hypothetical protein|nr:hypothetical protein [Candidatus Saccharimonadales bacterium]